MPGKPTGWSLWLVLFLPLISATVASAAPAPTAADAVLDTRAFCTTMGIATAGTPVVKYTLPKEDYEDWRPHWQVSFPGGTDVAVTFDSGLITSFSAPDPTRSLLPDATAVVASTNDALQRATAAVAATGISMAELRLNVVETSQGCRPARVDCLTYIVRWDRMFGGIPFQDPGAAATVQAATGHVTGMDIMFHSPPPASTAVGIDANTACATTLASLARPGFSDEFVTDATLEIVRPNSFWVDGNGNPQTGLPRVAWVCQTQGYLKFSVVCVDAATGGVIAGDHGEAGASLGPLPVAPPWIQLALQHARSIEVYGHDSKFHWMAHPVGTLSAPKEEGILAALAAAPLVPNPGGGVVGFKLHLTPPTGPKQQDLDYVPAKRLVGLPGEWRQAPESFVQWVKRTTGNKSAVRH